MEKIVSKNFGNEKAKTFAGYEATGGYSALREALKKKPEELVELVKASGLRGRGGAGFATGLKWTFVPKDSPKPIYLLVNADEGEPGTFKDREIISWDPHLLIEGIVISSYALKCKTSYIYIRGEYKVESDILQKALDEAYAKNKVGKNICGTGVDIDVFIHRGAGAYICGEETALINSLEGKRGYPRLKPPFPAIEGFFACPTIVNNVETLANIPDIVSKGPQWFRQWGSEKCPGQRLFAVSGHVQKPGVYEAPIDILLPDLIEMAGGLFPGRKLKAVIPGGASSAVLRADECNVKMDFDSLAAAGSMGGSGAVIVMDDTTDMVEILKVLSDFFAHESCGQCTPCREGSRWLNQIVRKVDQGKGKESDLGLLFDITDNMKGKTICVFADAAATPIESFIKKFRPEFEATIQKNASVLPVSTAHEKNEARP